MIGSFCKAIFSSEISLIIWRRSSRSEGNITEQKKQYFEQKHQWQRNQHWVSEVKDQSLFTLRKVSLHRMQWKKNLNDAF